jgi:hypothetical protein
VRSVLVSLPESVESWREKNNMASGWSRLLRWGGGGARAGSRENAASLAAVTPARQLML